MSHVPKLSAAAELMERLHAMTAERLLELISDPECPPATINAAIKFLHNNGIQSLPHEGSAVEGLINALPQFDEDEEDGYNVVEFPQ